MSTVKIGDREFRIGAWYAGRVDPDRPRAIPMRRKLLRVTAAGMVAFTTKTGLVKSIMPHNWLRWAGDEVQP